MTKVDIFLLDNSSVTIEEISIMKPKTYKELLIRLRKKMKALPEYYEIFIYIDNKEIIINNEDTYKITEDILFIREFDKNILKQSLFEKGYNKLSDSNKEILEEKYNCNICSILIKKEKPYLCYKCQKIFHEKCLREWDEKCKLQNKILICPNCRNELPLEKWNQKIDYEDKRKEDANFMNEILELKENETIQNELIRKYERYIEKTVEIFKHILNEINSLHDLLKLGKNNELNNLISEFSLSINNLMNIGNISTIINEELKQFKKIFEKNKLCQNNFINIDDEINDISKKDIIDNKVDEDYENYKDEPKLNPIEENIKEIKIDNFYNKINLKYFVEFKDNYNIFGEDFVENNKNNISLIIDGKQKGLVHNCELKEGENTITLLIKNKLTNLSHMFYMCKYLKDISELKFLDVSEVKDFSYMFYKILQLSDIQFLENWNVSNGKNFSYMFSGCSSLSDIKPLLKWNVSNNNNFESMFFGCKLLSDLNPLRNWDVFCCENFSFMFMGCFSLSDVKPLKSWKVSNGNNFSFMFFGCSSLSDIKPLQNWNVSNGKLFSYMFSGCSSLLEVKPAYIWDISKDKLKDIKKENDNYNN